MAHLLKIIAFAGSLLLSTAAAETFSYDRNHTIVGELRTVIAQPQDTFVSLAQTYSLGYEQMIAANPDLDAWVPEEGSTIILPGQFILPQQPHYKDMQQDMHGSIYINLAEMRLYYYAAETTTHVVYNHHNGALATTTRNVVYTYPISIGRGDWLTPQSDSRIIAKIPNPTWYPPESVRAEHAKAGDSLPRVVPPGDDNPLGKYALQLDLPGYFIHGTNRPEGIGMRVTHGCIRLRPADIETLFSKVPRYTPVAIQHKPFKVSIQNNIAYLEAHGRDPRLVADHLDAAIRELSALLEGRAISIDWERFIQVAKAGRGIPTAVNLGAHPLEFAQVARQKTQAKRKDYIF